MRESAKMNDAKLGEYLIKKGQDKTSYSVTIITVLRGSISACSTPCTPDPPSQRGEKAYAGRCGKRVMSRLKCMVAVFRCS